MKRIKRWASAWLIICMLLAATPVLAMAEAAEGASPTPTAETSAAPEEPHAAEPEQSASPEPSAAADVSANGTTPASTTGAADFAQSPFSPALRPRSRQS